MRQEQHARCISARYSPRPHLYSPSLVEVGEKDNVVAQTGDTVRHGHGKNPGKDVVDKGVKGLLRGGDVGKLPQNKARRWPWQLGGSTSTHFVHKRAPWQMRHALQLVVYK